MKKLNQIKNIHIKWSDEKAVFAQEIHPLIKATGRPIYGTPAGRGIVLYNPYKPHIKFKRGKAK